MQFLKRQTDGDADCQSYKISTTPKVEIYAENIGQRKFTL